MKLLLPPTKKTTVYLVTVVCAILLLLIGHKAALHGSRVFENTRGSTAYRGKVVSIVHRDVTQYDMGDGVTQDSVTITFTARILSGTLKGQMVTATQMSDFNMADYMQEVRQGDKLIIMENINLQGGTDYVAGDFLRTDALILLTIVFGALLLLFGRGKGFSTLLSLAFTCLAVFTVFIPAVLAGRNIYVWAMLLSLFTVVMNYLLISGANKKTLAAGLGCLGGVFLAGGLTAVLGPLLRITGIVDDESLLLLYIDGSPPIDLKAIVFAAIVIGSLGALMDVSMSISSALSEINESATDKEPSRVFRSGMAIGRDIMGTMTNTLILAYIGGSLSVVILLTAYQTSFLQLLNRELVVVEILQALVGSLGILLAIPFTSLISALLYGSHKKGLPSKSAASEGSG